MFERNNVTVPEFMCKYVKKTCSWRLYRILGFFRMGLIFAEIATSMKSPKIDTAKNKPYYTSSLRVLAIAKIGLCENLTLLPSVIFAKTS